MPKPQSSFFGRAFLAVFLLGLALIAFIGGAASVRYNLPPGKAINKALTGGEALLQMNNKEPPPSGLRSVETAIAAAKTTWDPQQASPGYTLLSLRYSDTTYLLDMDGKVVHRWTMPFSKAWPKPAHIANPVSDAWIYVRKAWLFPNGDLLALYESFGDTPFGYGLLKMDKDSNVLWTYDERTHHDIYVDGENGNIYTLVHAIIEDAPPGVEGLPYPMLADSVVTLSPDGKELARIPVLEAFLNSPYAAMLHHQPKNINLWDHLHTNSVMKLEPDIAAKFPLFKAGQLLISMRNMNAIAVLDPNTRQIVWAFNGLWRAQHSAQFLDNGNITLLDNKGFSYLTKQFSRAVEFNPATLAVTWHYTGSPKQPFYSASYGDLQRLPGGNTLIADPYAPRVFEVTPDGKTVWNFALGKHHMIPSDNSKPERRKPLMPKGLMAPGVVFEEKPDGNYNQSAVITSLRRYRAEDLTFLKK